MRITVDLNTATLGEIERFEMDAQISWDEFTSGKSSIRATMALICLQERRKKPDYTMDDARKLKVSDIEIDDEPDPPTQRKRTSKAAS